MTGPTSPRTPAREKMRVLATERQLITDGVTAVTALQPEVDALDDHVTFALRQLRDADAASLTDEADASEPTTVAMRNLREEARQKLGALRREVSEIVTRMDKVRRIEREYAEVTARITKATETGG